MTLPSEATVRAILARPYSRILVPDPEGTFSARILEFDGAFSGGRTPEEAAANLEEAAYLWVEAELERGGDVPEPVAERDYSGRLNFRMPPTLHERAALRAEIEGVSLNQLLVTAVAGYLGADRPAARRRVADEPGDYRPGT
ncbi:MAG: toxin-antitoxin system HicB family antitoxin [Dehalococcoidia bacterium]|nr:toxin-antitoxin system HicB family antitoxin [Dehalococcoidia bacterium]